MTKVSVLMGIYNCADTLPEAIRSIQEQTYQQWELILCDDGSTDHTYQVALAALQADPQRVRLLRNERNLGLNATLNRCLEAAQGVFVARQDGDDMSAKARFASQVSVLESRPDVAVVSAAITLFDTQGTWGVTQPILEPMPADLLRAGVFAHGTSMMRKSALTQVGGYSVSPRLLRVEDYHLWYKLYLAGYKGVNLPEVLYFARDDRDAAARRTFRNRLNECYVRWLIIRDFKLGPRYLPQLLRPLLVGLLPGPMYRWLHQRRLRNRKGAALD